MADNETAEIREATSSDFKSIVELLQSEGLPTKDLSPELRNFFVVEENTKIIAVAGMEVYGRYALIRSVVVHKNSRHRSFATYLLNKLLKHAQSKSITTLYLITNSAEKYFSAKGFSVIARELVPNEIKSTEEFSTLCPSTATVMAKTI